MLRKLASGFLLAYLLFALAAPVVVVAQEAAARQPDPSGANTGNASDVPAATPGAPTMEELAR